MENNSTKKVSIKETRSVKVTNQAFLRAPPPSWPAANSVVIPFSNSEYMRPPNYPVREEGEWVLKP